MAGYRSDMEEQVMIPSGEIQLEAVLRPGDPVRAGAVCHPHTLYGGNMHNNVVLAAAEALARAGWTALRFNFRGAGRSGGRFEDGRGEQEDVAASARLSDGTGRRAAAGGGLLLRGLGGGHGLAQNSRPWACGPWCWSRRRPGS